MTLAAREDLFIKLRQRLKVYALRYHAQFFANIDGYCSSIDQIAQNIAQENGKIVEDRDFSEKRAAKNKHLKLNSAEKNMDDLKRISQRFKIWRHHKKQSLMAGLTFIRKFTKYYLKYYLEAFIDSKYNPIYNHNNNQAMATTMPLTKNKERMQTQTQTQTQTQRKSKYNQILQKAKKASHKRYDQGLKTLSQTEFLNACQKNPAHLQQHFEVMLKRAIKTQNLELENRHDHRYIFAAVNQDESLSKLSQQFDDLLKNSQEFHHLSDEECRKKKEAWIANAYFERMTHETMIAEQKKYIEQLLELQERLNITKGAEDACKLYEEIIQALVLLTPEDMAEYIKEDVETVKNVEKAEEAKKDIEKIKEEENSNHLIFNQYLKKISTDWLLDFKFQRQQRNALVWADAFSIQAIQAIKPIDSIKDVDTTPDNLPPSPPPANGLKNAGELAAPIG